MTDEKVIKFSPLIHRRCNYLRNCRAHENVQHPLGSQERAMVADCSMGQRSVVIEVSEDLHRPNSMHRVWYDWFE